MAEVVAADKESDDAGEAVFGETDDEEEDIAESAPRRGDHEVGTSAGDAGSEEEKCTGGRRRSGPRKATAPPLPLMPSLVGSTSTAD